HSLLSLLPLPFSLEMVRLDQVAAALHVRCEADDIRDVVVLLVQHVHFRAQLQFFVVESALVLEFVGAFCEVRLVALVENCRERLVSRDALRPPGGRDEVCPLRLAHLLHDLRRLQSHGEWHATLISIALILPHSASSLA
ncbi:hypothetical protein PMAYCL1PPCAC_16300, partial [Pristionchus mayeri]